VPVVGRDVERSGARVDRDTLSRDVEALFAETMEGVEDETCMSLAAVGPFNVGSPKAAGEIILVICSVCLDGAGRRKKGKTGCMPLVDVLEDLATEH